MIKSVRGFLFLLLGLFAFNAGAQSLETDPAEPTGEGEACFENSIQVDYDITNITSGDLNFLWRVDRIDAPTEWELQICDAVTCYGYGQEFCPPDKPNTMTAGQEITFMSFKVKPNYVEGIGDFDLVFYNESDENDVYLNLPIVVTATACSSATHEESVVEELTIYPNPATNFFKVSNTDIVENLSIYNIVGKEVKSMSKNPSGIYDVADLNNGMYLVRMFDEDGDVIKVMRLNKR